MNKPQRQQHAGGDRLLQAEGVSCRLGDVEILRQVTFQLAAGELVGLVGPNGAGKSTLLRVLGGLLTTGVQGRIALLGRPLSTYSPREVARLIAHVPQATALDFPFTVRDIVLMGRSPHLGRFQLEGPRDRTIAEWAMRTADVLPFGGRLVSTLSGGERQRVLIARALAQEPAILLLDEPTSNLDIKHQLALLEMVRSLAHRDGLGVVAAIHDLPLAARFCDRIVLLTQGRVVAAGRPDQVFTPARLAQVFGVEVSVEREPTTGYLRLYPLRPAS